MVTEKEPLLSKSDMSLPSQRVVIERKKKEIEIHVDTS